MPWWTADWTNNTTEWDWNFGRQQSAHLPNDGASLRDTCTAPHTYTQKRHKSQSAMWKDMAWMRGKWFSQLNQFKVDFWPASQINPGIRMLCRGMCGFMSCRVSLLVNLIVEQWNRFLWCCIATSDRMTMFIFLYVIISLLNSRNCFSYRFN